MSGPAPGSGPAADPAEVARRSTEAMMADDAASALLGMSVEACGPGTATLAMEVRPDLLNGWGTCHGGVIAALADSAFAVACNSHGEVTVGAGFDITILEPAHVGDRLVATATERAVRGRSGVYDVEVVRAAREAGAEPVVVAEFRGRSRSLGRPNPGISVEPG